MGRMDWILHVSGFRYEGLVYHVSSMREPQRGFSFERVQLEGLGDRQKERPPASRLGAISLTSR